MRKWLFLTALIVVLSMTAGCGGGLSTAGGKSAAASVSSEVAGQSSGHQVMEASKVENEGVPLTDEEILDAYDRAVTAYGWFDLNPLPCSGDTVAENGDVYYRVNYAGIETMEDLETYLRGLFSEEIVQTLLKKNANRPLYQDLQGALYELPFSRSTDLHKGKVTETVEKDNDTRYVVNITVETLSEDLQTVTGMECDAFPYENINGRWVFTEFELVN